jgi:hypothetical protein
MEKTIYDSRISRDLCMYQFEELANEYLQKEFGRQVKGGCSMTWYTFKTQSYAKDHTEKQINVLIDYDKQTITLSHR